MKDDKQVRITPKARGRIKPQPEVIVIPRRASRPGALVGDGPRESLQKGRIEC